MLSSILYRKSQDTHWPNYVCKSNRRATKIFLYFILKIYVFVCIMRYIYHKLFNLKLPCLQWYIVFMPIKWQMNGLLLLLIIIMIFNFTNHSSLLGPTAVPRNVQVTMYRKHYSSLQVVYLMATVL